MKLLDEDLKKNIIKNVYLLHGSQAYLRNQYRDRIINLLVPTGDTMNVNFYNGDNFSAGEIIDLAETMPFLSEHRVIVVENSGIFKDGCEQLEEYFANICETTCLIFSEESVDGRLKITKTVKSKGTVAVFSELQPDELNKWILGKIKQEHKQISREAMDYFVKNCGMDMFAILNELEKVFSYTFGRDSITLKDVEAVCTKQVEDTVFSMLDAMFSQNTQLALKYYGDLVSLQVEPIKTLALISSQLRLFIKVKIMSGDGISTKEMAKILGANEYRIQKSLPHAKKSSKIWLMRGLELCADADYELKNSGNKRMPQVILENIILTLSGIDSSFSDSRQKG